MIYQKKSTKLISRLLIIVFVFTALIVNSQTINSKKELKEGTRQIHLDFHTSELIPNIGEKFNKKQFQEALKAGNVNAINVFAKCHHSWSYYPTKIGKMHPNLKFDLMGQQIEACREIGVKVIVYVTVGWSATEAIEHPEWAVLDRSGTNPYREMKKKLKPNETFKGWEYLAPEGPYADLILAQTKELLENYDFDGFWFDIHRPELLNYNEWSRNDFATRGINVDDINAVQKRQIEKYEEFYSRIRTLVSSKKPNISVFFNGSTATSDVKLPIFKFGLHNYNTKYDLEDLPTSWDGYDIFPWRSKYFANTSKEITAMSGKFHKSWGEFGGFKHPDALKYEAASMIAFGANVNIGDQLHPSGEMDMSTYKNIGIAFDYVKKIEEYGIGGVNRSRVGLLIGEKLAPIEGVVAMLLEKQIDFNVANTLKDWSDIEVLIITSGGVLETDIPRIREFVKRGGKVIGLGSGMLYNGQPFLDAGAKYLGNGNYDIDFTLVNKQISNGLVESPFLNYKAAIRLQPSTGTEILAKIYEPYFSRTIDHYCSHENTPNKTEFAEHPAIIRKDNIIWFAHDIDKQYREEGARLQRDLFINALNLLLTKPFVKVTMPSAGRINLLHQSEKNRYVVHLLYASPIQRGSVRVIEDLVPLYNTPVTIDVPEKIKTATLIPSGKKLKLNRVDGKFQVIVPEFTCHAAVVFGY